MFIIKTYERYLRSSAILLHDKIKKEKEMKKLIIAFVLLFTVEKGFALLPPLYEGIAEIRAILTDEKLSEVLTSGEVIQEIHKTDAGYMFYTNHHQLNVVVKKLPAQGPGPAKFELEFKEPVSLK